MVLRPRTKAKLAKKSKRCRKMRQDRPCGQALQNLPHGPETLTFPTFAPEQPSPQWPPFTLGGHTDVLAQPPPKWL
jgi:hypothetical protein